MKTETLIAAGSGLAIGLTVALIGASALDIFGPKFFYSEYKLNAEAFKTIVQDRNFSKLYFYCNQRLSGRRIQTDIRPRVETIDGNPIPTERLIEPTEETHKLGFLNISHPDEPQIYFFSEPNEKQLSTLVSFIDQHRVAYFILVPVEGSTLDPDCKEFLAFDMKPFDAGNVAIPIDEGNSASFRINPCPREKT